MVLVRRRVSDAQSHDPGTLENLSLFFVAYAGGELTKLSVVIAKEFPERPTVAIRIVGLINALGLTTAT